MNRDIENVVRHCLVCSNTKGHVLVTGHQRSREYDGPFRYLIVDYVGPIYPPSNREHRYLFTCVCPWSGWYWCIASDDESSKTAARLFFHYVVCDIAGTPPMLGSDRGKAFVESMVKSLVNTFSIHQVLGSAYTPQAQSTVERPHRTYNGMAKMFLDSFKGDWDLVAPIFQWTVRTTAKIYNTNFTPYEIIRYEASFATRLSC